MKLQSVKYSCCWSRLAQYLWMQVKELWYPPVWWTVECRDVYPATLLFLWDVFQILNFSFLVDQIYQGHKVHYSLQAWIEKQNKMQQKQNKFWKIDLDYYCWHCLSFSQTPRDWLSHTFIHAWRISSMITPPRYLWSRQSSWQIQELHAK